MKNTNLANLLNRMETAGFFWKKSLSVRGMTYMELKREDANHIYSHNFAFTYKDEFMSSYEIMEYHEDAIYVGSYYTINHSWYASEIILVHCFR